jgi:hypothetical protein
MALEFAHGVIQWLSTDVATTTYTVSGLAFQPKALIFKCYYAQEATDGGSVTDSGKRCFGFATSPTNRACVAIRSGDNAANASCQVVHSSAAIATFTNGTPTVTGALDLDSITSDGFVLIVDTGGDQSSVFWEAYGGSDITAAEVVTAISEPASTGAVDYVLTGAFQPDVVFLAGMQGTGADAAAGSTDSHMYFGVATSTNAANQICLVGGSDHGSADMDTDGWGGDSACVGMVTVAGGDLSAQATLSAFNADGFELTWGARATTNRKSIALAIAGGEWQAGSLTIDGSTATATAAVSGLSFVPAGVSVMSRMQTENASVTTTAEDMMSFGVASSTSSREAWGRQDVNAAAASDLRYRVEYDQILCYPDSSGALLTAHDLSALASDGFTLVVDTAGGVADEWIGYYTFGNPPAAGAAGHGHLLAFHRNRLVYT